MITGWPAHNRRSYQWTFGAFWYVIVTRLYRYILQIQDMFQNKVKRLEESAKIFGIHIVDRSYAQIWAKYLHLHTSTYIKACPISAAISAMIKHNALRGGVHALDIRDE